MSAIRVDAARTSREFDRDIRADRQCPGPGLHGWRRWSSLQTPFSAGDMVMPPIAGAAEAENWPSRTDDDL